MAGIKICIVEDEVLIAELAKRQLEQRGHVVTDMCISYEEAIHCAENNPPDLFIIDIRLYGEKSGIDLAAYLAQNSLIPYIFLTSQYDSDIVEKAIATSPFGYVTKPFNKETLWTSVEAAVSLAKSQKFNGEKLQVFDGKKHVIIKQNDLVYVKSEHVYLHLHLLEGSTLLIRNSKSDFLNLLDDKLFIEPHRSFIVNRRFVTGWDSNELFLEGGLTIPISRDKRVEVLEILEGK
jgi:DNA-binding LytR/AlgR family response regulator